MTEQAEWEWRTEEPTAFEGIDGSEFHAVYALGELCGVIARLTDEDAEDAPWAYFSVYSVDREGFGGFEHIDSFESLDEAKGFGDEDRDAILAMIREERQE